MRKQLLLAGFLAALYAASGTPASAAPNASFTLTSGSL